MIGSMDDPIGDMKDMTGGFYVNGNIKVMTSSVEHRLNIITIKEVERVTSKRYEAQIRVSPIGSLRSTYTLDIGLVKGATTNGYKTKVSIQYTPKKTTIRDMIYTLRVSGIPLDIKEKAKRILSVCDVEQKEVEEDKELLENKEFIPQHFGDKKKQLCMFVLLIDGILNRIEEKEKEEEGEELDWVIHGYQLCMIPKLRYVWRSITNAIASQLYKQMTIDPDGKMYLTEAYRNIIKSKQNEIRAMYNTGTWSAGTTRSNMVDRRGIVQMPNTYNELAYLAHLYHVTVPLSRKTRSTMARLPQRTHSYVFDPMETPEGDGCGLTRHLVPWCRLRVVCGMKGVNRMRKEIEEWLMTRKKAIIGEWISIVLECEWMGSTKTSDDSEVVEELIRMRREEKIWPLASIRMDKKSRVITIRLDAGVPMCMSMDEKDGWIPIDDVLFKRTKRLHPCTLFSFTTGCIPFANHNQGVRLTFGGTQIKQASGMSTGNTTFNLFYPQKAICNTITSRAFDLAPAGQSVVVAVLTMADNQEDGIIVSERFIQLGGFASYFLEKEPHKNVQQKTGFRFVKPGIGDKLSSFSGQKGVISRIMPYEDLPFDPLTGITPDVIISPHSIPTRKTVSQLFESLLARKAAEDGVSSVDATAFREDYKKTIDAVSRFDKKPMIDGRTGESMGKVAIGIVQYFQLKHLAALKAHVRCMGPRQFGSRQPTVGRANDGASRLGKMEIDALIAHGANRTLYSLYTTSGDGITVYVCKCRTMHGIPVCNACGSDASDMIPVRTVYSFVRFVSMCASIGVSVKVSADENPTMFINNQPTGSSTFSAGIQSRQSLERSITYQPY
jgi:DNA-directed RNA polymerase beta subunit